MPTFAPDNGAARSAAALAIRQVQAVDAWNEARHEREALLASANASRETRMDAARRLEALQRAHSALLTCVAEQLAADPSLMPRLAPRRVVVAHRHAWFADKLSAALTARRVTVTAVVDNGADVVGAAVAEQPEILLVEDALPMMNAQDVLAELALFAPATVMTVRVAHGERVGEFLDAGARSVFTRQISPVEVADAMVDLLPIPEA
jgi:CheY-like chemotaxis protein